MNTARYLKALCMIIYNGIWCKFKHGAGRHPLLRVYILLPSTKYKSSEKNFNTITQKRDFFARGEAWRVFSQAGCTFLSTPLHMVLMPLQSTAKRLTCSL